LHDTESAELILYGPSPLDIVFFRHFPSHYKEVRSKIFFL